MKYLLTVFVAHKRQEDFVISLAKEVQTLSKTGVKYFFGEQTILMTFETQSSFQQTSDFFSAILGDLSIPFVLSPTDKMAYWFNKENEKHLFGTDLCNANDEYSDEEQKNLMDDLFLGHIDNPKKPINDGEWASAPFRRAEHKYDELFGKQKVEVVPTLDELLDKINVGGMKSLTEKEKQLLNKYSK